MKQFILKFLLSMIPFAILVMVFEGTWIYNKELVSIDKVLKKQMASKSETYYLRKDFSSNDNAYKLKAIGLIKPEILVIGTSRVMEFRRFMFTPFHEKFYTAGGAVHNIYDVSVFIDKMIAGEIQKPKLLFIGLDPWLLQQTEEEQKSWILTNQLQDDVTTMSGHHNAFKYTFKNMLFNQEFPSFREGKKGFGAYGKTGFGYRKDGSVHYNMFIEEYLKNPIYVDREDPPIINRIVNETHQFTLPINFSGKKEALLLETVKRAEANDMEVILFFPPFSDRCYEALDNSMSHQSWWKYYTSLPSKFRQNGIDVIAYLNPGQVNLNDNYMIDGYHPSEVFVAHLFLKYIKENHHHSDVLRQVDTTRLYEMLHSNQVIPISFMDG